MPTDHPTPHQKRALAALWQLWKESAHGYFTRLDIGRIVFGDFRGITQKTIAVLMEAGLVEPESRLTMRLVEDGVCRCGCDRYRITEVGRKMVSSWNVVKLKGRGEYV